MHQSLATEYLVVTFSFYINISYQTNWVGQHTCSSFPATQACNLVRTQHTLHFFSFTITYTSRLLYRESFIKYYNSTILTAFYNSSSWLLSSLLPSDLPTYIYTKTSLTGWQHKTDTSETCSFFKMPIYFLMITLVDWTEKTVNFSLGIKKYTNNEVLLYCTLHYNPSNHQVVLIRFACGWPRALCRWKMYLICERYVLRSDTKISGTTSGATALPQASISVLTWCQLALYTVTVRTFWNTSMHSVRVAAGKKSFITSWIATIL